MEPNDISDIELCISCDACVRRGTPHCDDCLVQFVLGGPPNELTMSPRDADIITLLTGQGLMPRLKYRSR